MQYCCQIIILHHLQPITFSTLVKHLRHWTICCATFRSICAPPTLGTPGLDFDLSFRVRLCFLSFPAEEECPLQTSVRHQSNFGRSTSHKSALEKKERVSAHSDDGASPPSKYKSSLLHRYLNDTVRHMMAANTKGISASCKRSDSESFSSNECDQDAVSPASSFDIEANYVYHMGEKKQTNFLSIIQTYYYFGTDLFGWDSKISYR